MLISLMCRDLAEDSWGVSRISNPPASFKQTNGISLSKCRSRSDHLITIVLVYTGFFSFSIFLSFLSPILSLISNSGHLQWASLGGWAVFERAVGDAEAMGVEIDEVQNWLFGKQ